MNPLAFSIDLLSAGSPECRASRLLIVALVITLFDFRNASAISLAKGRAFAFKNSS